MTRPADPSRPRRGPTAAARAAVVLAALAAFLTAGLASAQGRLGNREEEESFARGFDPHKAFDVSDVDSINPFSGTLSLALPIGRRYPVNAGFSFGFTLTYSSQIWDFQYIPNANPQLRGYQAWPSRSFNAGLGWQLGQGRLFAPQAWTPDPNVPTALHDEERWIYLSPDGARHYFYSNLHDGSDDTNPNLFPKYTRDGSYLRLVDPGSNTRCVEFPDGGARCFADLRGAGEDATEWRLFEITDAFGNRVLANRTQPTGTTLRWAFSDDPAQRGGLPARTWEVDLALEGQSGTYAVQTVRLPAVGGAMLDYDFHYSEALIDRGCNNAYSPTPSVTVSLLTRVDFPDGSFHEFDYPTGLTGCDEPIGGGERGVDIEGVLSKARLKTGGFIRWTYDTYYHPSTLVCAGHSGPPGEPDVPVLSESRGIAERILLGSDGSTEVGRWSYHNELDPPWPGTPPLCDNRPREFRSTLVDPLGHRTLRYYSAFIYDPDLEQNNPDGWNRGEYGLPFTRRVSEQGAYLSQEIFSCMHEDAATDRGPSPFHPCDWQRSEYVLYEQDPELDASCEATGNESHPRCSDRNRRVEKSVTADFHSGYVDDRQLSWVTHSQFDGYGHHERSVTGGNFNASDVRTTHTEYEPPTVAWILDNWAHQWVDEAGRREWLVADFDDETGFLNSLRAPRLTTVNGGVPPLNTLDAVVCYEPEELMGGHVTGNRAVERWLGGDLAPLPQQGDPCAGQTEYRIERKFTAGVLRSSEWVNPAFTAEKLSRANHTSIDADTGLVLASDDPAAVTTTLGYDPEGRLTFVQATGDAATEISHNPALASGTASVYVEQKEGTAVLTREEYFYDPFGRLELSRRRLPDEGENEVWGEQERTYWAAGWPRAESAWRLEGDTERGSTRFREYDALGRSGLVLAPDDQEEDFTFLGARDTSVMALVRTAAGFENEWQRFDYDRQGRLYVAKDNSDPNAPPVDPNDPSSPPLATRTYYTYDAGDRLVGVLHESRSGAPHQNRYFHFDGRGFMTSETHPEIGAGGNGTVTYGDFDSRGNPGFKAWSGSTARLEYTYDFAGRLTRVVDEAGRPYQELTYARSNSGSDLRAGKLVQAKRRNHLLGGEMRAVTESFFYDRPDGRTSATTVRVSDAGDGALSFAMGYDYDPLGNLSALTYPQCSELDRCPAPRPSGGRTVEFTYDRGLLSAVSEPGMPEPYATLFHDPNGLVTRIDHGNGLSEHHDPDPDGIARPARIRVAPTAGGAELWDTSSYSYDARGNVYQIGTDAYRYDTVSRLVSAVQAAPTGGTTAQTYGYDRFGNLRAITTDTLERGLDVDLATNRLKRHCVVEQAGGVCAQPPSPPVGATYAYDVFGNVTTDGHLAYAFDSVGQLVHAQGAGVNRDYLYDADGERVVVLDDEAEAETWTLRGAGEQVLTELEGPAQATGASWNLKDYLRSGSRVIASVTGFDVAHFHLDHLGSTRLVTGPSGAVIARHDYRPYGEELTDPEADPDRIRFTGHERDFHQPSTATVGPADDLDYMHARYYSPWTGRFLSVDSVLGSQTAPGTWNRYQYASSNPLKLVDPDGNQELPSVQEVVMARRTYTEVVENLHDGSSGVVPDSSGEVTGEGRTSHVLTFDLQPTVAEDGMLQFNSLMLVDDAPVLDDPALIPVGGPVEFLISAGTGGVVSGVRSGFGLTQATRQVVPQSGGIATSVMRAGRNTFVSGVGVDGKAISISVTREAGSFLNHVARTSRNSFTPAVGRGARDAAVVSAVESGCGIVMSCDR